MIVFFTPYIEWKWMVSFRYFLITEIKTLSVIKFIS